MRQILFASFICVAAFSFLAVRTAQPVTRITQEELVQHTQELVDAVAPGNREPWQKYFAEDVMFFDERGRNMNKQALVADIQPMPTGYSGNIKVVKPQSHIEDNVAILSYDMDETETIFGQTMKARYHSTDTWMFRQGKWQIVAAQVLRYYEDPAPGKPNTARFADYLGTYELAPGVTMSVTMEDGKLFNQRNGRAKEELIPESADIFFRKGVEGRRLFRYNDAGKVDALIDRRNNEDVVWKKVK
jgi:uncharacterized protein DUF4440/uncharacterized protein DUF3471